MEEGNRCLDHERGHPQPVTDPAALYQDGGYGLGCNNQQSCDQDEGRVAMPRGRPVK
jgi:hypothetical protein